MKSDTRLVRPVVQQQRDEEVDLTMKLLLSLQLLRIIDEVEEERSKRGKKTILLVATLQY